MYLYWSDVDSDKGTVRVTAKPEFDFTVKDYEERTVAAPHDNLMGELYKLRQSQLIAQLATGKPCRLVFPTAGGKPNSFFASGSISCQSLFFKIADSERQARMKLCEAHIPLKWTWAITAFAIS